MCAPMHHSSSRASNWWAEYALRRITYFQGGFRRPGGLRNRYVIRPARRHGANSAPPFTPRSHAPLPPPTAGASSTTTILRFPPTPFNGRGFEPMSAPISAARGWSPHQFNKPKMNELVLDFLFCYVKVSLGTIYTAIHWSWSQRKRYDDARECRVADHPPNARGRVGAPVLRSPLAAKPRPLDLLSSPLPTR